MRKLRLELDDLAVESFATAEGEGAQGTVRGLDDYVIIEDDVVLMPRTDETVCTCPTGCTGLTCCDPCVTADTCDAYCAVPATTDPAKS